MTPIPLATLFASRRASGAFADSRNRTVEPSRGADSYVFDGQTGYLYHDLASANLLSRVAGTPQWHINANEPCAFDYNDAPADTGESEGNLEGTPGQTTVSCSNGWIEFVWSRRLGVVLRILHVVLPETSAADAGSSERVSRNSLGRNAAGGSAFWAS
jgi:hypothetical protein